MSISEARLYIHNCVWYHAALLFLCSIRLFKVAVSRTTFSLRLGFVDRYLSSEFSSFSTGWPILFRIFSGNTNSFGCQILKQFYLTVFMTLILALLFYKEG